MFSLIVDSHLRKSIEYLINEFQKVMIIKLLGTRVVQESKSNWYNKCPGVSVHIIVPRVIVCKNHVLRHYLVIIKEMKWGCGKEFQIINSKYKCDCQNSDVEAPYLQIYTL